MASIVGAAIAVIVVTALPAAAARGERSFELPQIVEAAAPAGANVVRSPRWEKRADPLDDRHDILAIGSGSVVFGAQGRLCGYAESSGSPRWCVANGTKPAYAGGEVAFSAGEGGIESVDAIDGSVRWRYHRSPITRGSKAMALSEEVWAAGTDFLARNTSRGIVVELSRQGKKLWSASVAASNDNPLVSSPYAFFPVVSDGAYLTVYQQVVRLGAGGGPAGAIESWQVAATDGAYAIVTIAPLEEVQDHALTFDVGRVDARTGNTVAQFHFEPDYDINAAPYLKTGSLGAVSDTDTSPLRVDGTELYADVMRNVYRYRFAEPSTQHPLLVARDAELLGGPYHGAVFVRRHDGVWSLRPQAQAIRARLMAASTADVVTFAIAGHEAYAAFKDGTVRGFNAGTGAPLLQAKPCRSPGQVHIGTSARNVYVACDSGPGTPWHIFAFTRSHSERTFGTSRREHPDMAFRF